MESLIKKKKKIGHLVLKLGGLEYCSWYIEIEKVRESWEGDWESEWWESSYGNEVYKLGFRKLREEVLILL